MGSAIKVNLSENSYQILIGQNNIGSLGHELKAMNIVGKAVIITNPVPMRLYGTLLIKSLNSCGYKHQTIILKSGETSKSARTYIQVLEKIACEPVKSNIFIIALGGGVVGDLAGFVASTYRRGVPYIQVPTTLLAQIDSAIGGKTAIDLTVGKNLVGSIYQPRLVLSDTTTLTSLDQRQIRNGLAEAVKYGVIAQERLFDYLSCHIPKLLTADPEVFSQVVDQCSRIKARIVEQDEKETRGIRTILNFGHTVGHAIEAAGEFKTYHHGEAVALGMRIAAELSVRLGYFSESDAAKLGGLLTEIGLPQMVKGLNLNKIMKHMQHDKKFINGKTRFVLAIRLGQVKVVDDIAQNTVLRAVKSFMS